MHCFKQGPDRLCILDFDIEEKEEGSGGGTPSPQAQGPSPAIARYLEVTLFVLLDTKLFVVLAGRDRPTSVLWSQIRIPSYPQLFAKPKPDPDSGKIPDPDLA